SHEIRTPLAGILGAHTLLLHESLRPESRELVLYLCLYWINRRNLKILAARPKVMPLLPATYTNFDGSNDRVTIELFDNDSKMDKDSFYAEVVSSSDKGAIKFNLLEKMMGPSRSAVEHICQNQLLNCARDSAGDALPAKTPCDISGHLSDDDVPERWKLTVTATVGDLINRGPKVFEGLSSSAVFEVYDKKEGAYVQNRTTFDWLNVLSSIEMAASTGTFGFEMESTRPLPRPQFNESPVVNKKRKPREWNTPPGHLAKSSEQDRYLAFGVDTSDEEAENQFYEDVKEAKKLTRVGRNQKFEDLYTAIPVFPINEAVTPQAALYDCYQYIFDGDLSLPSSVGILRQLLERFPALWTKVNFSEQDEYDTLAAEVVYDNRDIVKYFSPDLIERIREHIEKANAPAEKDEASWREFVLSDSESDEFGADKITTEIKSIGADTLVDAKGKQYGGPKTLESPVGSREIPWGSMSSLFCAFDPRCLNHKINVRKDALAVTVRVTPLIDVGSRVILHSLQSKSHLNGKTGVVDEDEDGLFFRVKVLGEAMSLPAKNLRVESSSKSVKIPMLHKWNRMRAWNILRPEWWNWIETQVKEQVCWDDYTKVAHADMSSVKVMWYCSTTMRIYMFTVGPTQVESENDTNTFVRHDATDNFFWSRRPADYPRRSHGKIGHN
ncbi:MAG: hypothetical protein ACPGR8_17205, partial [Limisphaerales bacterium]